MRAWRWHAAVARAPESTRGARRGACACVEERRIYVRRVLQMLLGRAPEGCIASGISWDYDAGRGANMTVVRSRCVYSLRATS